MDNSVKALYIAAGVLLGVMILSAWFYLFRQGASLGQNYEADRLTEQITAFNSQFDKYSNVTIQRKNESYGYSFETKGNNPSDVITCANLAYNINRKNDYDEKNCIEVEVEITPSEKYYIYSATAQPKNCFLINTGKISARNATSFDTSKCKSFYDFMQKYNNVKIVNISSSNYNSSSETIYEYYFDVPADNGIHYNDETGRINYIRFKAVPTTEFGSNGKGKWSENL